MDEVDTGKLGTAVDISVGIFPVDRCLRDLEDLLVAI